MFNRNWKVAQNLRKFWNNDNVIDASNSPFLQLTKADGTKIMYPVISSTSTDLLNQCKICYKIFCQSATNNSGYNVGSSSSDVGSSAIFNFGGGNTTPTINDINLENQYKYGTNIRQIELIFVSRKLDEETKIVKNIYKGRYVAITDMNICELGLSVRVSFRSSMSGTSTSYQRILLSRDVLPEPLVVTAGQMFSVSLTIEEKLEDIGEEVSSVSAEIE